MEFNSQPNSDSSGSSYNAVMERAARDRDLRFSNFLLTFSTNVVPINVAERIQLTNWLLETLSDLFDDWSSLNGSVLKPAGSPNVDRVQFDDDHLIASVKSKISVEAGEQRGQMHAHVLMEVCHHYTERNNYNFAGVHVNRDALQSFMDNRIPEMNIAMERRPNRIYVNSRLLTRGTDNTSKWLTLAYINKNVGRDNNGGVRNLATDRTHGTPEERSIRQRMLHADAEYEIDP